jgi:hypothetical protein
MPAVISLFEKFTGKICHEDKNKIRREQKSKLPE